MKVKNLKETNTAIKNKDMFFVKFGTSYPDDSKKWYDNEFFTIIDTSFNIKARIKFRSPMFVNNLLSHRTLNKEEIDKLIKFLNKPIKSMPGIKTKWQYGIVRFNRSAYNNDSLEDCMLTQKQLDKLPKDDPRKYYLPIDLPMPDYTEL